MKDLFQDGIEHFNGGSWFEAHEAWEDLWRETDGEPRSFYQGLVQIAVGLHHISHGNLRGGRRVLLRGLEKIRNYPGDYAGIDNTRLQQELLPVLSSTTVPPVGIHRCQPEV